MATGTVLAVGAGMQAGGSIYSGIQGFRSSKRQKRALEAQANFNRQQAQFERELGEFDAMQQSKAFDKLMSRQRLSFAASGIELAGSPLDILEESARDKKDTIEMIKAVAESKARALEFGAGQLMQQGRDTVRAGRNALIGSIFGGIGSGLKGYGQYKQLKG